MDKSPDAFRTISEVAADLDLPQHVLRFWETRFVQIKPLKRGGGRRYYRPDDVELLKGIRHLLYGEGYTIRGVQRILKEQGVRFVMNVWHDGAPQPPPSAARWDEAPARDEPAFEDDRLDDDVAPPRPAASPYAEAGEREEPRFEAAAPEGDGAAAMAQRFAPRFVAEEDGEGEEERTQPFLSRATPRPLDEPPRSPATDEVEPLVARRPDEDRAADAGLRATRLPAGLRPPEPEPQRGGIGQFLDRLRPGAREGEPTPRAGQQSLSRDEIRRLQSTLFELLECKRLLDQVR